jgi:RNA 3'-terminal phosphate cyclase
MERLPPVKPKVIGPNADGSTYPNVNPLITKLVGLIGDYLADQLLIPFALAGSGEFITGHPTSHAVTNAQTISKFLDRKINFREETGKTWRCVTE